MMVPTLFSVTYAGLWGQHRLDLKSFIRKAAQLGYPAVELMGKRPHLSPLDATDQELDAIRETAESAGVEIATVAAYTDFAGGGWSAEVPFVELQVGYVKALARMAGVLGAKNVRVFTGYWTDPQASVADWERCVRAIRECAIVAEDFGVTVGVQNHHDVAVGFDSYVELLNDVDHPNCKAMFDPWSPAVLGSDLRECARLIAPRMVQTTLADYVRLERHAYLRGLINYSPLPAMLRAVPLGQGFLDLDGFFAGLKEGGFSGYVAYEICSPMRGGGSEENLDASAGASLKKIKELIGGAG
jgi:sugar phosphate isomerase/epimerase